MDTLPSNTTRIFRRDGDGGLSTGDIIGIAVACGSVAILILSLFLWRLLARCCRRKPSAPLPPVQDLAHRREQQLAILNANRSTVWLDNSVNSRSKHFLHPTASDVSLISGMPERKNSFYTDEGTTAESSTTFPSPLSANDLALPPPNPMFFNTASPHNSMTSMASSNGSGEIAPVDATPPEVGSPVSEVTSTSEHGSLFATPRPRPQPSSSSGSPGTRSVSRSASRQRSRPSSMVSYAATSYSGHTMHTMRTTNSIIRGAPHGPHSNVQIVLPAPLAPEVYPYMQPLAEASVTSFTLNHAPSRSSSYVDQWVMVGNQSMRGSIPPKPSLGHGGRSSSVSSMRTVHPPSAMPPFRTARRSHSQPRISLDRTSFAPSSQTPSPQSLYTEKPPPVPRIPSEYAHASRPSQATIETDPQLDSRGRSRASRSGSQSSIPTPRQPPQAQQYQQQPDPRTPRMSGEGAPRRSRSRSKLRKPKPDHVS
ncbi:hypothetical protein QCA50_001635 [Cerrena zonata]|uniref:Uncharacterized protein n=1 Tax=Cerrena zonata TaxID=2478898 RepID=A0AAW0GXL1_9APHY